jgi:hypothetical protein
MSNGDATDVPVRRDQLEHAIRTACQIIGRHEVIAVGSRPSLVRSSTRRPGRR